MNGGPGRKSVVFVAKVLAGTVHDLLTDPSTLEEAHTEFERASDGALYDSPLPDDATLPTDLVE